jgi:hypothetical protein
MLAKNALPSEIEAEIKRIQNEDSLVPKKTKGESAPEAPQTPGQRLKGLTIPKSQ